MAELDNKPIILNNRLVLNFRDKLRYYAISLLLYLIVIAYTIYGLWNFYIADESEMAISLSELLWTNFWIAIVSSIFFLMNYNGLKFEAIKGQVTADQLNEAVKRLNEDQIWRLKNSDGNVFQFYTIPKTFWSNRRQRLTTIVLEFDRLLINSITEPEIPGQLALATKKIDRKHLLHHLNAVRKHTPYTKIPEINDTQWNWKMVLARVFLYPLCALFYWLSLFHLIPAENYAEGGIMLTLASIYLFADLYMIFKKQNN